MTGRLDGKVCLITGGASGIGAATARIFNEQNAIVIITDIQDEKGDALVSEIGCTYYHQDVRDEARWAEVSDAIITAHGRLDVLVNNAGIFLPGSIEETDMETWNKVIGVNLTGVMLGCREAVKCMKDNPGGASGSIINVSSITGFVGLAGGLAYTTSKGGVRLLTKSVAVHCGRTYQNIRCNSVHPGTIDTPMNQAAFDASEDPDGMRAMFAAMQPNGRMIDPSEIANGILFLASDEASATNGTELLIDSGWLAAPNPL
ncbi:MAG: SDR family oxidoreductase [Pseudomonadota bacterium]